MRLLKPGWVHHDDKQIFSVDIHQDCTKFATGGQGSDCGRVVIWNMLPVLSEKAELDEEVPKMLCQMDQHLACVNCVRWSQNGQNLASGSDDKLIMIWRKSTGSSGVFGTGGMQKNHESWKCFYTLRGHDGDVLDLAWSPNDAYLASCGIDNTVIVWDAQAFPHSVATLKDHTGLVKGVSWDPVGRYLASQSDDRSIKIWNTMDWTVTYSITEPFEECGGTTHFLRLSWSPDGQYLVSAHALNAGVPTAQIVERVGWKTETDFVGHRKAVTCVRFHSSIMQRPAAGGSPSKPLQYCVLAVGSRDRSLSVWMTALQRPMIVIHELFDDSILDLSWGPKECLLMACSGDGTMACLQFSEEELGKAITDTDKHAIFQKMYGQGYGAGLSHHVGMDHPKRLLQPLGAGPPLLEARPVKFPLSNESNQRPISKQTETRTKDGKRRITPMFIPLHEDGPTSIASSMVSSPAPLTSSSVPCGASIASAVPTEAAATPRIPEPLVSKADQGRLDSRLKTMPTSQRRQSVPFDPGQAGADQPRSPRVEEHQSSTSAVPNLNVTATGRSEFVKAALDYRLHVQNGHLKTNHGMLAKVTASDSKEMLWEFYVGSPVVNLNLCGKYAMLCSLDGSMRLISMETGCPVFPAISLTSSAVHCAFSPDNSLVGVLTECGLLRIWDIAKRVISLAAGCSELLNKHGTAVQFAVTDQGMPLIGFPSGNSYSYSTSLQSWLVLATKDAIMYHGIRGTLPRDMDQMAERFPLLSMQASSQNYFCFTGSMELRHSEAWQQSAKIRFIENQIKLCETLQSLDELKHWHKMLTFQLATHGSEKRMRLFLDDLLSTPEPGVPQVVPKLELMQCVLDTLKPHSEWQRMYSEYVELLEECKEERSSSSSSSKEIFATPAPPLPKAVPSPADSPSDGGPSPNGDDGAAASGEEATGKARGSPPAVAAVTGTTTTTTATAASSSSSSGSGSASGSSSSGSGSGSGSSSSSSSSSSSLSVPPPAPSLSPEIQVLDSPTVCIDDELSASSSLPPLDTFPAPVSPSSTSGGAPSTSPPAVVAAAVAAAAVSNSMDQT
ncbi:protein HIRA homolog [Drosophila kikkawai]|uniref:Protein HIRA n=1 Tax=Drosophila kikkawai TaxID=30033 RepID=A0A6P4JJC9_DROKI|nr:protein HIRA homolog [Drosophila kikkawai]